MNIRSRLATRGFIVLTVAVTLGLASVNDAFAWGWLTAADTVAPKAKSKHPPIAGVRQRMLEQFHGQATNVFANIPGFGMERMPTVYRYIPFQTPEFSTNDVEVAKETLPPELLKDVFALSLDGFRDPAKPLVRSKGTRPIPPKVNSPGRLAMPFGNIVNRGLQLRLLDLVGLIDPDGARVYSGGKAFLKERLSFQEAIAARGKNPAGVGNTKMGIPPPGAFENIQAPKADAELETRPLDIFEIVGVAELTKGKDLFVREKGQVIRMLGALRATEKCLKCHTEHKQGDLLGAFSYTFVDTDNTLRKAAKGNSAQ